MRLSHSLSLLQPRLDTLVKTRSRTELLPPLHPSHLQPSRCAGLARLAERTKREGFRQSTAAMVRPMEDAHMQSADAMGRCCRNFSSNSSHGSVSGHATKKQADRQISTRRPQDSTVVYMCVESWGPLNGELRLATLRRSLLLCCEP